MTRLHGHRISSLNKREIFACVLLTVFLSILSLIPPLSVGVVLDRVIQTGAQATLVAVLLALLLLLACEVIFIYIQDRLLFYLTVSAISRAETQFLRQIASSGFRSLENFNSQHGPSRFASISTDVRFQADWLINSIATPFCLAIAFVSIYIVNQLVFWNLAIVTLIYGILHRAVNSRLKNTYGVARTASDAEGLLIREIFSGALTLKVSRSFDHYLTKWLHAKKTSFKSLEVNSQLAVIQNMLGLIYDRIVLATILGVGTYQALGGYISVGQLVMINMLFRQAAIQIRQASPLLQRRAEFLVSQEAFTKFLSCFQAEPQTFETDSAVFPFLVHVDGIGFTDSNGLGIVSDISFKLSRNSITAIIGESGSGKSTLLKLLSGAYAPTVGTIAFSPEFSGHSDISLLPQSDYLFSGTIEENISLGRSNSSDSVPQMLGRLNLKKLLSRRNLDYTHNSTVIPQHKYSGGECQRISFARSVWPKAKIYLFDEPTTGLDPISKSILMGEIQHLASFSSIVFATHDVELLNVAERVMFIRGGRIIEEGVPALLLADKSSHTSHMFADLEVAA